ncbi:MAG TPA: Ppx/GppA phosphatase family protein [Myxococcales bacterium]|nr:Ppx/GppA phosphatase family protein [Myxococcales bacterium]
MRVAAIDVGTNSVLLTVAERQADGLAPALERAEITRLGRGVDASGRLSDDGIARTLEVLRDYAADARRLGAERIACVATSAARDAANGASFLEQVRALGLEPQIIGGEREAQLSFLAARRDFGRADEPLAVLDVGGGSTEITYGRGAPEFRTSLDVGSVRLFERLVRQDPPSHEERLAVRAAIDAALSSVPEPPRGAELVGVAGTLTTLATLVLGLPAYDAARVHGARLSLHQVSAWANRLWALPLAERRALPGLQPLRADVIPVGVLLVEAVLYRLRFPEVTVSDRGVRWGLLYELAG